MPTLTFADIPQVVDDDEMPFVIGLSPDRRPSLELDGFHFRRGIDVCILDFDLGDLRMCAVLQLLDDGNVYLMANAGPLLNEWWPLLNRSPQNSLRPWLSAGVARHALAMRRQSDPTAVPLRVAVAPPDPSSQSTRLVLGIGPGMTTENLVVAAHAASAVIKAALMLLLEYRTLVEDVPPIDVQNEAGATVALKDLLRYAELAANAIAWERVP